MPLDKVVRGSLRGGRSAPKQSKEGVATPPAGGRDDGAAGLGGGRRTGGKMPRALVSMGPPEFAVPTLVEIAGRGYDIAAVYTRAPKPAGRGLDVTASPVAREAERLGLTVLTPATFKTAEAVGVFRAHGADAAGGGAYGPV